MSRIRTIKPEFFTSEDIVELSAMARLFYIALWCEADREGRMQWKPRTFKMRYFPADDCDIDALSREIIASGLVVLYGNGLAFIPSFLKHQHINPRESASTIESPNDASCTRDDASVTIRNQEKNHASLTRDDASLTVSDAQVGREGKGSKRINPLTPLGDESPHDSKPKTEKFKPEGIDSSPIPADLWESFCGHRRQIRKPLTENAARQIVADFAKAEAAGLDAAGCVMDSIRNGWQGVFFDRAKPKAQTSNAGQHHVSAQQIAEGCHRVYLEGEGTTTEWLRRNGKFLHHFRHSDGQHFWSWDNRATSQPHWIDAEGWQWTKAEGWKVAA